MKKYLTILLFLCCAVPFTVYAAGIFQTQESFQLAKAFKLGRSKSAISPLQEQDFVSSTSIAQECAAHCSSCNQTNGVCSGCESGYTLQNNQCKRTECAPGKYFNGSACSDCPSGQYSNGGYNTECTPCSPGTYASDSGNASCTPCSPGTYASGTGNTTCATCSSGSYSAAGASVCTSCSSNCTSCIGSSSCIACASGYHVKNGVCVGNCENVTCVSGAKKVVNDKSCCCVMETASIANCATQSGSTCTKCNSGYYLKDNTCVSCPSNATCTGTSSFTCNSGYYRSTQGCLPCKTGCSTCTSSTNCTSCSNGTTPVNGACVNDCDYWSIAYNSCSKGYRKPKSGGSCEPCPANTECGTCPSGCTGSTAGTCQTSGAVSCIRCANHELTPNACRCPVNYTPTLDGTTCVSISGYGVYGLSADQACQH